MRDHALTSYPDTSVHTLAVTAVISFLLSLVGWGVARLSIPQVEVLPPT